MMVLVTNDYLAGTSPEESWFRCATCGHKVFGVQVPCPNNPAHGMMLEEDAAMRAQEPPRPAASGAP